MDALDYKIMSLLEKNGRMSWSDLSACLKMSAPSAAERVKRLEEKELIKGYRAVINDDALGIKLTAFVAVSLTHPKHRESFLKAIHALKEVLECHHIAGDDDYLLKVRCKDTDHLDNLLSVNIKSLAGIAKTRTTIVLKAIKEK